MEAASLGKALAAKGQTVILIDWAPAGGGIAEALGHASVPGMLDLVAGRVKFEDVVGALGQSGAHLIPAGSSLAAGEIIDPNHVNFVLDALDGVYDQIIVASREEAARHLFEAIEGRFDCGITVVSAEGAPLLVDAQTFLGYDVDGIELMRYVVPASFGKASGRAAHLTRQEPRMRVG
jgi:MinD-like ATPase involved in chromosome partitioning or flagellar assembly